MKVLVTGGTGVVGRSVVTELLARGHTVRLLSRHADRDAAQWPEGVEPRPGDVGNPDSIRGSAAGCDAVLHVVGVVAEDPPEVTFDRVNVQGTRAVVDETRRAAVGKLVFVSSLGADRGDSDYHRSKRAAEDVVRTFGGNWVIVRPGSVYGPGDEQISLLLRLVRTAPVIPLLGDGGHVFQPIWCEDLARALADAVERDDLAGRTLDVGGAELTSQNDLIERFCDITDRRPLRVPVPEFMASLGTRVAAMFGAAPLNEDQLTMIREGNVIRDPAGNALVTVFGITPTPLDEGLRTLADAQLEVLPDEGVGALKRKRFWADITGARHTAEGLFEHFCAEFDELLPLEVGAEPGTPLTLREGQTLTLALPLRGHVQVRVLELTEHAATLGTVAGHPLAGAVRFLVEPRGEQVRFEIQVFDRAATLFDFVVMRTVGDIMQNANWARVVERMVDASGGTAPEGVQSEIETLDEAQADRVEEWLEELVMERRRAEHGA